MSQTASTVNQPKEGLRFICVKTAKFPIFYRLTMTKSDAVRDVLKDPRFRRSGRAMIHYKGNYAIRVIDIEVNQLSPDHPQVHDLNINGLPEKYKAFCSYH